MKARLLDTGGTALPGSPAEFGRLMAEETAKWAKVIKASSVRAVKHGILNRPCTSIVRTDKMIDGQVLRRQFLRLAAGAVALPAVSRSALASDYPTRPVHVIVGYPPGSGPDINGRLIGQSLSERLGQPFVIENRPGAGGNIATEVVVKAPADGYTLLLVTSQMQRTQRSTPSSVSISSATSRRSPALCARHSSCRSIHRCRSRRSPSSSLMPRPIPARSTWRQPAPAPHRICAGELFKMMTGVDLVHVPYRGGAPAMVDLIGGQVQVGFSSLTETIGYIKSGKLRALAVTTAARSNVLPGIPTMGEFVPGYEASAWVGIGAPKNTPTEIIDKLNADINAGLTDPKLKARFADLGATVFVGSPADFGGFIADETEKWAKVVKFAGIKPN